MSGLSVQPVPITLLTGFLGSGKTTVLNTILRHADCARTVVIINEFGEIGLDHELVVATTETMILLQSGCMCCSLRGDLLDTLIELSERREAGQLNFDRVIIETTGLSDPAPILHTLLTSVDLFECYAIDGVVVTVDAAIGFDSLVRQEEARRQVALADLILLTKTDLPEANEAIVRDQLGALNGAAPIEVAIGGDVQPARLFGLGHFDPAMKSETAQTWLGLAGVHVPKLLDLDALKHLDAIRSVSWVIDEPLTAAIFDIWMDVLMARWGGDILRFKGLVHLKDEPHPFVMHGVQHIFHPPVMLKDWQGEDRRTKFVMIVRDFTDPELKALFDTLSSFQVTDHVLPSGYLSAAVSQ